MSCEKFKPGDKCKVLRPTRCGTFKNVFNKSTKYDDLYIVIRNAEYEEYTYDIFLNDKKVNWCYDCFTDEHLEPYTGNEVNKVLARLREQASDK